MPKTFWLKHDIVTFSGSVPLEGMQFLTAFYGTDPMKRLELALYKKAIEDTDRFGTVCDH